MTLHPTGSSAQQLSILASVGQSKNVSLPTGPGFNRKRSQKGHKGSETG